MSDLETFDHRLFHWINFDLSNPLFDFIFPQITDLHKSLFFGIGLIVFLALFLYRVRGAGVRFLIGLSLAIGLSDLVSYRLVKIQVHRMRPDLVLSDVILRTHIHTGFSFPSIHASNVFAFATFFALSFPRLQWFGWTVALLVAFSRVYIGVHFPSDVFGGAFLGAGIGWITWKIYPKVESQVLGTWQNLKSSRKAR